MTKSKVEIGSGSAFNMSAIVEQLKQVLGEDNQPVTCRWLSYEHAVPASVARRALETCAEQSKGKVAVTYLVSGKSKASGQQSVQLVKDADLEATKGQLVDGGSHQIYALAPGQHAAAPLGLHVSEREQAQRLMAALLSNRAEHSVSAYESNGCSMVRGVACRRKPSRAPASAAKAAVARSAAPETKPKPTQLASKSAPARPAQNAAASILMGGARPAADAKPEAKAEAAAAPAAAAPAQRASAPAQAKAAATDKDAAPAAASAMASAFAKGTAKAAARSASAKAKPESSGKAAAVNRTSGELDAPPAATPPDTSAVGPRKASASVLDDDDDMDSASPLPTRNAGARRRQLVQDDDSDDDAAMDARTEDGNPGSVQAEAARSAAGAADEASVQVPSKRGLGGSVSPNASPPSSKRSKAPQDAVPASSAKTEAAPPGGLPAHPEYGVPPDPDAEIQTIGGKPFWAFINDKGEEVTVVRFAATALTKDDLQLAKSAKNASQPSQPLPAKTEEHKTAAMTTSPAKAAKGKSAKKPIKMAGARDIRSMFGKK